MASSGKIATITIIIVIILFSFELDSLQYELSCKHSRNLANNIGKGGAFKSTTGIRNLNLGRSQVTKREKIGLNQSSIYIHPLPLLSTKPVFFYWPFNSSTK